MTEFKTYERKATSELRPYEVDEVLDGVSIAQVDKDNGSPKVGDMIARNPKNHDDQWLVAAQYFKDNFKNDIIGARTKYTFSFGDPAVDAVQQIRKLRGFKTDQEAIRIALGDCLFLSQLMAEGAQIYFLNNNETREILFDKGSEWTAKTP